MTGIFIIGNVGYETIL